MKKVIPLLVVFILSASLLGAQTTERFIVKLTDKQTKSFSIDNPEAFLSKRAIERRERMGLELTSRDLPISPEYVKSLDEAGYKITNRIKWLNTLIVEGEDKAALKSFPFVKEVMQVVRNEEAQQKPFFENEDYNIAAPASSSKTRTENVYEYGEAFNQIEMLNGHIVHNAGYDGEGMVIAVLDAGFRKVDQIDAFDSLWANEQILGTRNYVNSENVFSPTISSHGMAVLSTMGGNLPGEIVGTAPKADYWLVRTEDASDEYLLEEYYWVDGAEFADSAGADIINSSLGYTNGFNDPENNHTYEDMNGDTALVTIGADIAASTGILVVNSAGNSGNSSWFHIGAPADGDSVMAVGAVDGGGNYVSFSSKGPSYDGRVKPNVAAKGSSATVASEWGGVTYSNGTSFSSPITAGMVASIWQANPYLSNMELIALIQEHGNQYNNPDSLLGYGIPDYGAMLDVIGLGSESVLSIPKITIAPNPFINSIQISSNTEFSKITLFSISGNILRDVRINGAKSFTLSGIGNLSEGMYFVKVESENGKQTVKKVIKN